MAAGNKNLNSAKTARKDEFYTQLTDIEKEMRYYRKHFRVAYRDNEHYTESDTEKRQRGRHRIYIRVDNHHEDV